MAIYSNDITTFGGTIQTNSDLIYDATTDIFNNPTLGSPRFLGGGTNTPIDVIEPTPIIPRTLEPIPVAQITPDTNQTNTGTSFDNTSFIIYVVSNIESANILVDGDNTFQLTPNKINITVNDILSSPTQTKTITVAKTGYESTQKYVFSVIKNPLFSSYLDNTNIDKIDVGINVGAGSSLLGYANYYDLQKITLPAEPIYSNEKLYNIKIEYYQNDILQSFPYLINDQNQTIIFDLLNAKIKEEPLPNYVLPISLDGVNDSVQITKNATEVILLKSGANNIPYELGDTIRIESSNTIAFRLTNINVSSTIARITPLEAGQDESLATTLTLNGEYSINVVSIEINKGFLEKPVIEIANTQERKYNKNSNSGVPIQINLIKNVSTITAYVGNTKYLFDKLDGESTAIIIIPEKAFTNVGNYRVVFVPSNSSGDGDSKEVVINVVDEFYVGVPDLRNILYPSIIKGADYVGTNVDFEISWDSINTDFVRIYNGESTNYVQENKAGKVTLNFQNLIDLGNQTVSQNEKSVTLTLGLVPYNISGAEEVIGKKEIISIELIKGENTIPRNLTINRILEGFTSQFDDSIFEEETSKYLTHILHIGNADNKVITTWTGSLDTLIVKLYEPIPTSVQPNQQVWISKIQSNPIIETITIVGKETNYCPPLKGPNFNLIPDNGIGFKVFDELIGSGSLTSNDLVLKYAESKNIDTTKLNIQYVSSSNYLFENFVHFGSAEERVKNFFYKVQLLESYESKVSELNSNTYASSSWTSSIYNSNESNKTKQKILELKRGFDGFENFLYNDVSSSLSYPKINSILEPTTASVVEDWYDTIIEVSETYDKYNGNYLSNNIPEYVREDYNNEDFIVFLDMIGQHFDIVWSYINGINKTKLVENKQLDGIANDMVYHLLESMGWQGKRAFDSQFLWEYVFGQYKDGTKKYDRPLEDANNEIWRRILNNLPYLLKHKGTARAMKAIMACYGVPQSMLTIMEFGGPQDPTKEGSTKFTFEDRTAAIQMRSGSLITIPWKVVPVTSDYPESVEFRIKPDLVKDYTLAKIGECSINLVQTTGSFVQMRFSVGSSVTDEPYFESSFVSASVTTVYYNDPTYTTYALPPDTFTGSVDFPLSTEYYSNVLVNRYQYTGSSSLYEVLFATSNGSRITTYVSMSLLSEKGPWESGSIAVFGNNFSGALDELRFWKYPLQPSKFENHTLFPDAINGNSYTASTADLLLRLDFEYPKDRTLDNQIKNVSISTQYGENFAIASRFYSASVYPYQYIPYDRTVTATVPSLGFNYSNKIRFESASLVSDLSHKVRATKKAFDQSPIDSNRLGLFFSPIKELNMDIVKAFGDFNIDNYIGDPSDEYKDSYKELEILRNYYFERLDRNIYEYIQLVKYIDKSLFDVLADLAPARAKVSKGLLIEPHFLERSKVRWDRPTSEKNDYDANIVTNDTNEIESSYHVKNADIVTNENTELVGDLPNYDAEINSNEIYVLEGTNPNYDTNIEYNTSDIIEITTPFYDVEIEAPNGATIIGQADSFTLTQIGMEKDSLANLGFGIYAKDGNSLVTKWDGVFGRLETTGSRKSVFLVKEQTTELVSTQIAGYPVNGAQLGDQIAYADLPVIKNKYKVSILPFSGSITIGNNVVEVTALNGYFPTHYKYTNNLSEGLQRSYWKGSIQNSNTTPDGLSPVEIFTTNPNILRVAKTGRGSGEPILEVD
jgi:hypothetical protein